ncbi:MAG: hypothetical protein EOO15_01230 [Chitinophagaceae bacterium]|nr:MAG: hypothetical protein EOO15_01230 [Chitinophagaceae bacterium]
MQGSTRSARLGWHLLLALLLLLMQQAALRHAFQHTPQDDAHPAHSTLCKECLAFASIDAVASSTQLIVLDRGVFVQVPERRRAERHTLLLPAYQSRAPPRFSVTA